MNDFLLRTDEDYRLRTREITFRKVNRFKEKTTVVVKLLKDVNLNHKNHSTFVCPLSMEWCTTGSMYKCSSRIRTDFNIIAIHIQLLHVHIGN